MATYNFTGANGSALPAGLTAQNAPLSTPTASVFEIQSNSLAATAVPNTSGAIFYETSGGSADDDISLDVTLGTGGTAGSTGLAFRQTDGDNYLVAFINPAGNYRLFSCIANTFAQIGSTYAIPSFSSTSTYTIRVVFTGTSITCYLNGVSRITGTSSFNQSSTKHGARLADTTVRVDNFVTTSGVANSITVGEASFSNKVYQRTLADIHSVSFPITFSGTPTELQYRLLDAADDTTEITTWATFDATPTGGTSTLTFNAPASTTGYHVEVRFLNETGTTDLQTVDWYVGDIVLIMGQSLSVDMNTDGAITAPAGYFYWNGTASVVTANGVGSNEIARGIIGSDNVAVLIVNTGSSGKALTFESGRTPYWNDPAGSLWTTTTSYINTVTDGNNQIAFVWWHQGTTESVDAVSKAVYQSALGEFFTRVRAAFTSYIGATNPIIMAALGRHFDGVTPPTDATQQAIRSAQIDYVASDANAYLLDAFTTPTVDGVHGTEAGYITLGQEIAATYYFILGDIATTTPAVLSASIGDTNSEIDVVYNSNLLLSDTTYSTEGVRVEVDGTPLTVTGFARKNTNTATITVSETITTGVVTAYTGYGVGTSFDALNYPKSTAATLPNTGGSFSITSLPVDALTVELVTLNLSITGLPDGNYTVDFTDPTTGELLARQAGITFTSGSAISNAIPIAAGTTLEYTIRTATHVMGDSGVTA